MVAPTGERVELLAVDPQTFAWDGPVSALRAGVGHTAWTVDDLDAAHARAVEAGGRSVWTPRDTPEPGLRIAFVADPDGNLVELPSSDEIDEERWRTVPRSAARSATHCHVDLR